MFSWEYFAFLSTGADVNRRTAGDDHSVLSLACAGGHAAVVELLLGRCANPGLKLKVSWIFYELKTSSIVHKRAVAKENLKSLLSLCSNCNHIFILL